MDSLIEKIVSQYIESAENQGTKKDWNRLGIAYARFERYQSAASAFERAVDMDRGYIPALVNLANLQFLDQNYVDARASYEGIITALKDQNQYQPSTMLKLLINVSRTCYQLEDFDAATRYFSEAERIDSVAAAEYSYLSRPDEVSAGGRAAAAEDVGATILFEEDVE
jgi:tetratricopeptide (TPR) repeat protein